MKNNRPSANARRKTANKNGNEHGASQRSREIRNQHSLGRQTKSPTKASIRRVSQGHPSPAEKQLASKQSARKQPAKTASTTKTAPRSSGSVPSSKGLPKRPAERTLPGYGNPSQKLLPQSKSMHSQPTYDSRMDTSSPIDAQKSSAPTKLPTKEYLKSKFLTRRNFLIGAGGAAAIAAIAFGVDASKKATQQAESDAIKAVAGDAAGASSTSGDLSVLSVPQDAVFTTENCEYIDDTDSVMRLSTTVSLPHGTLVWANDDTVAACLLPTDTSTPLTQIGILQLGNGNLVRALSQPVGADEGYQIYDVRANSLGAVWVEADILNGNWRIYHSGLSGSTIASPVLVAEGNDDWEMPSIAISGGYSFWQMVPNQVKNENVSSSKLKSSLMRAAIGSSAESAETVFESKGYMACAPTSTITGIAFAPRSAESGTYYQLTHVDAQTGEITDQLTLPASMKPTEVSYGSTGFSFSFDGIYQYGDGIANLGTYTPGQPITLTTQTAIENARLGIEDSLPKGKDGATPELSESELDTAQKRGISAVADLYSAAEWFRFPRTPLTTPAWCGSWFLVKSTNVVAGVDLTNRRYFTLKASGNGESYGEFLASSGTVNRVVTYANLDYTPINGEPIKECSVRIWNVQG